MNRWRAAALVIVCAGATAVASVLAAARILSPASRRGIELVAFTPVGLPAALLGAIGAIVLLRRHRRLGATVLALALASAALHAWWLAPRYLGEVPASSAASTGLVVMVQNLEDGEPAELVRLAEQHQVDVLVLTDVTEQQASAVAVSTLREQLPHTTLEDGRGSVVWSRFPITADAPISEGGESRIVGLAVPDLGAVDVVAVHPSPPYAEGGTRWQADWDEVLDRLEMTYGTPVEDRVAVVGDFNATPDHGPVRTLARWGFRDAGEQLNTGLRATWPANGRMQRFGMAVPPFLALDHVMTSRALVATEQVVSDAVGGDHRAVIATLAPTS